MENFLKNYGCTKFLLLGHINGLADEARKLKCKLSKAKTGEQQAKFAANKPLIKSIIRHRLLAYAFLTGKSYFSTEKFCAKDNQPSASSILDIINSLGYIFHPVTRHLFQPELKDIETWLGAKMS